MNNSLRQRLINGFDSYYELFQYYWDNGDYDRAKMCIEQMNKIEDELKTYYSIDIKRENLWR